MPPVIAGELKPSDQRVESVEGLLPPNISLDGEPYIEASCGQHELKELELL